MKLYSIICAAALRILLQIKWTGLKIMRYSLEFMENGAIQECLPKEPGRWKKIRTALTKLICFGNVF